MSAILSELHENPALIGSWALEPALSTVSFETKAMWVLPVKGTFAAIEGRAAVTSDGGLSGWIILDAASVNTGNDKRDQHLRTPDFLDSGTYPTLTFTAISARPADAGDRLLIEGVFTAHGVERPLTVSAQVATHGLDVTVTVELDLDRGDWGVDRSAMGVSRKTRVTIRAAFAKSRS
jgi:polyisoprenoid-binding protein YceI